MPHRALAAVFVIAVSSAALADDSAPPQPSVRPPVPTPAPSLRGANGGRDQAVAAALLREGSHLLHAHGEVRQNAERTEWRFHVRATDAAAPDYRFTLLPNAFIGELLQVIDASEGQVITFELTGNVFVFRGRNYLLVSHPPRVVAQRSEENEPDAAGTIESEVAAEPDADDDDAPSRPASAEELMRDLERSAGPIHRAAPAAESERQPKRAALEHLLPEGTLVVQRRGRVSRDGGGGWSFILDADVDGLSDPSMMLLPCLLLQRIEEYVQRAGSPAPVLISGRVTLFEGRNYLLPTLFLTPHERTPLTP